MKIFFFFPVLISDAEMKNVRETRIHEHQSKPEMFIGAGAHNQDNNNNKTSEEQKILSLKKVAYI